MVEPLFLYSPPRFRKSPCSRLLYEGSPGEAMAAHRLFAAGRCTFRGACATSGGRGWLGRLATAPGLAGLAGLLLLVVLPGCVRRRLTIRTTPPGAQVFVDDQEIGTTPCSAAFTYYGTRKITVMKDGYRTETLYQRIPPPWYEWPPLDFIAENLLPREIRDERVVDVQLVPEEIVPPQRLLERAQALRDSARSNTITPLLGGAAPPAEPIRQPPPSLPGQGLPGGQPLFESPPPPSTPSMSSPPGLPP